MEADNSSHVHNSGQKSVTNIDRLQLLIWKNFLIQIRHYIRTIMEIVLFVFFISSLYFMELPATNEDLPEMFSEIIGTTVGLLIVLSFAFPTINSVRYITIEKERQLKEAMKIMGLPTWMHWTSWFIRIMVFMIIAIAIIVILLKVIVVFFVVVS